MHWLQNTKTKDKFLHINRCFKYMPTFLIEGNMLHAKLNTSKYRDYIYDRITGNCLSNLPVDFMRKKDNCKVMILKNIQLLVKKDIKSYQERGRKARPNNSVHLCGSCTSIGYQRSCIITSVRVFLCTINTCILVVISAFLLNMVSLLCMYSYI